MRPNRSKLASLVQNHDPSFVFSFVNKIFWNQSIITIACVRAVWRPYFTTVWFVSGICDEAKLAETS